MKRIIQNHFFREYSIQKIIKKPFFLENSNQKFEFGFIQFNKIFIQLENQGIEDHYLVRNTNFLTLNKRFGKDI